MIHLILLIPALFILVQGIARLANGPKTKDETPEIARRNGIIFTIVGGLLVVLALGLVPILSGAMGLVETITGVR
ncbi:hypothetical protein [Bremerella sp.]|uniref:hypothetical protein n=1 Tax=Bremerella sp. TaxID=2795602 RepID=UPI00391AE824